MLEEVSGDVKGGQQQLGLDVLVDVVEAGHVRSSVTHHEVSGLSGELGHDLVGGGELGDVALELCHARQRGHRLQVHGNNLDVLTLCLWSLELEKRSNFKLFLNFPT